MPELPSVALREFWPADISAAAQVLARAFVGFPVLAVVVGTGPEAQRRLERLFELALEPAARSVAVVAEVDGRIVGVMTYADSPDCATMGAGRTIRFVRLAGKRLWSTLWLFGRIEKLHPRTVHRHLPTIGVDPAWQGFGIGERLIDRFTEGCDDAGLEGYLETIRWADPSRPSHEAFYGRRGFVVADELVVGHDWRILTMTRPVGAASSTATHI